jgi:sigma-B regulation protein RsbU (phosphoserine phosphatase)
VFLDTTKSRDEFRGAKERMEGELNAAKEIQMSMLPLTFPPFPQRSEFSVFATLAPAREVGGDFYDFFFIDEDRFCFCIGDVSGKGVPAALFMAVSKSLIKSRATADFSSASIITHVNNELGRDNDACMFVTVFLGILDVKTGALTYTNAGHNPPYLLQSDGGVIQLNQCHGLVVAAMEGTVYGEDKITVIPGDLLLTFTDGVTEAMDVNKALYSDERLTSLMSSRQFESVEEIVDVTVSDVWDFQGDAEQADDVTVLAIQYFGEPKGKAL